MSAIDRAFRAEVRLLPDKLLRKYITDKIVAAGAVISEPALTKIIHNLRHGVNETVEFEGPDVTVTLNEADFEGIEKLTREFVDRLPDLVGEITDRVSRAMRDRYETDWRLSRPFDQLAFEDFKLGIQDRWGGGLDGLRMLLDLSLQLGGENHRRLSRSKAKSGLLVRHTIVRLHARACQTTAEIILLLENGYADGAMARWRTLHEITMVATVLADGDDELSERYLAHEVVEAKQALDEYERNYREIGMRPLSKRKVDRCNANYERVVKVYGDDFKAPYAWASKVVGKKRPKFSDIENLAGNSSMRSYYKMASYNIHATPRGISFRLGNIEEPGVVSAGASNAGIEEPGSNAAFSITHVSGLLFRSPRTMDALARMKVLVDIRNTAVKAFHKSARELMRDHKNEMGKSNKKRRGEEV